MYSILKYILGILKDKFRNLIMVDRKMQHNIRRSWRRFTIVHNTFDLIYETICTTEMP